MKNKLPLLTSQITLNYLHLLFFFYGKTNKKKKLTADRYITMHVKDQVDVAWPRRRNGFFLLFTLFF